MSTTSTLPDGRPASVRIHRTGSVEAMVGGQTYTLHADGGEGGGGGGQESSSTTTTTMPAVGSPGHMRVGDFGVGVPPYTPTMPSSASGVGIASAYRSSPGLARSILNRSHSAFSSNIHNSRAVLAALRALQDKIRNLEVRRVVHCSSV